MVKSDINLYSTVYRRESDSTVLENNFDLIASIPNWIPGIQVIRYSHIISLHGYSYENVVLT